LFPLGIGKAWFVSGNSRNQNFAKEFRVMASIESMRVVARHLNVLVRRGGNGTMIPKIGSSIGRSLHRHS